MECLLVGNRAGGDKSEEKKMKYCGSQTQSLAGWASLLVIQIPLEKDFEAGWCLSESGILLLYQAVMHSSDRSTAR